MTVVFIFIGQMPFLSPMLDNADPLFALMITSGLDLHRVELADQDPAIGKYSPCRLRQRTGQLYILRNVQFSISAGIEDADDQIQHLEVIEIK